MQVSLISYQIKQIYIGMLNQNSYFMYFERKKKSSLFLDNYWNFRPQWLRYALNCAVQCALEEIRLSSQNRGLASHLNHYVSYPMKLFQNIITIRVSFSFNLLSMIKLAQKSFYLHSLLRFRSWFHIQKQILKKKKKRKQIVNLQKKVFEKKQLLLEYCKDCNIVKEFYLTCQIWLIGLELY